MRRVALALSLLIVAASMVLAQERAEKQSDSPFRGPEVSEAGQLYGANVAFITGLGIVVLEPTISAEGDVESVKVIRSTPGMQAGAIQGVKTWKFQPARIHGKPVRSRATVVVVFNQGYNVPPAFSLPPRPEETEQREHRISDPAEDKNGDRLTNFSPALPLEVVMPAYPIMSAMTTTVILQVKLDADGDVDSVSPLHDVAAFAPKAIDAVKKWKFDAATFDGLPVRSAVTVAVFFTPAASSN